MMFLFKVVCFVALCWSPAQASDWGYDEESGNGPSKWAELYPTCGGQSQSPIDVKDATTVAFTPNSFTFTNYDKVPANNFTLMNSGHSAQINVNVKDIVVSGGGLPFKYTLEQFHFHWGKDKTVGSEHLMDNKSQSMEIHFVHYNSDKYSSVSAAVAANDSQGVAVFAVFATVGAGTPCQQLKYIADNLTHIPYEGNTTSLAPFAIKSLFPEGGLSEFYRYQGSLTTPECNEVVVWTVFTKPLVTNDTELAKFRQLHSNELGQPDEFMDNNYRPTQPLNGRVVNKASAAATKKITKKK